MRKSRTCPVRSQSFTVLRSPTASGDQSPDASRALDSDEFFQRASRTGPERDNTQKIEDLLKRMTLEEKVGQMTQLAIAMVVSGRDQDVKIDPAKLEKAIVKYGVGSILNVSDQALTVDQVARNHRPDPGNCH